MMYEDSGSVTVWVQKSPNYGYEHGGRRYRCPGCNDEVLLVDTGAHRGASLSAAVEEDWLILTEDP
jgi:hypothetical protein